MCFTEETREFIHPASWLSGGPWTEWQLCLRQCRQLSLHPTSGQIIPAWAWYGKRGFAISSSLSFLDCLSWFNHQTHRGLKMQISLPTALPETNHFLWSWPRKRALSLPTQEWKWPRWKPLTSFQYATVSISNMLVPWEIQTQISPAGDFCLRHWPQNFTSDGMRIPWDAFCSGQRPLLCNLALVVGENARTTSKQHSGLLGTFWHSQKCISPP